MEYYTLNLEKHGITTGAGEEKYRRREQGPHATDNGMFNRPLSVARGPEKPGWRLLPYNSG